MPRTKRPKPLYQRGNYRLDRRPDRPGLIITRYDPVKKRERVTSAGTSDPEVAQRVLDTLFLEEGGGGGAVCPTCGQPVQGGQGLPVTQVINDYLLAHAEKRTSSDAIGYRLAHVVDYLETLHHIPTTDQIDGAWVSKFRVWLEKRPIVTPKGREKKRSLSTIENSVLQLAAAINWAFSRGDILKPAQFKALQPKDVNRTPTLRAGVPLLIQMFEYASDPVWTRRKYLLRYLQIAVATWARPDAAHDVSTDKDRDQWHSKQRVLNLNPRGRRQTSKYRATVKVVKQVAELLDGTDGYFIPINSVKSPFETMMTTLGHPPGDGDAGMKLIRRSMADIARERLDSAHWPEIEIMLGHEVFDETSGIYAPFRPDYLRNVLKVVQDVCDEIEKAVPRAFYREFTAQAGSASRRKAA